MLPVFINIFLALHVFVSLLLLLVVLMQRPKSEGLGAAFGGGMTENIFGAQTTHVLGKFTVWLGGAFFVLTLTLAMLYARQSSSTSSLEAELMKGEPVSIGTAAAPEDANAATTETPAVDGEKAASEVKEEAEVTTDEVPAPADAAPTEATETTETTGTTDATEAAEETVAEVTETVSEVATEPAAAESTPVQ